MQGMQPNTAAPPSTSIRALRLVRVGEVQVFEEPMPEPGPGEALVKVTAVGLCGSDAHWFSEGSIGDAALSQPLVLGHEFAGVVATGPRAGERVALDPAIPCLDCEQCHAGKPHLCERLRFAGHGRTDGALRTFMAWPERCLTPLPANIPDVEAPLLEPLGIVIHSIDLVGLKPDQSAGVYGCGPIGLLLISLLRAMGVRRIYATDILPHRIARAKELGATLALRYEDGPEREAIMAATGGRGVDVAFDVSGSDGAIDTAVRTVRQAGTVVLIGIPSTPRSALDASAARRKELTIRWCRRMMPGDLERAARVVESGRVSLDGLVTERFSLDRGAEAFQALVTRRGIKVVVEPNG
jgi:L-iditol 2-dehydrogenase